MKHFNLSGWAVSHPALIVPCGCAGRRRLLLLRAAWPRGGSLLHRQGCERLGDLGGSYGCGDADPGRRSHREEAAGTALLRKGADLFEAVVHCDAGHVQGFDAAKGRAVSVLSAAEEDR